MAHSNENANGGSSAGTGTGDGGKKAPLMDIKKYLEKNKSKYGKSIAEMLEVLFKNQLFNESEWSAKVKDVVERQVK